MSLYETQNEKWCHVNLLSSVGPDHTNDTRRKILTSNVFKISETHQLFSLTQKMVKKNIQETTISMLYCAIILSGHSLHFASEKPDCFGQ